MNIDPESRNKKVQSPIEQLGAQYSIAVAQQ